MMTESTNNQNSAASGPGSELNGGESTGKALIIGIVIVALLMSGYAWWHQKQKGRRTLEFWGSRVALRLRYGKEIQLLRLASPQATEASTGGSTLDIGGQSWGIVQSKMINEAKGLVHARQALVFDPSYEWNTETHKPPVWQYALRFMDKVNGESEAPAESAEPAKSASAANATDQPDSVVLLFDLEHSVAGSSDGSRTVKITIAEGLKTFFEENLERQ